MATNWGFDIGTNSIGWAIVEQDNESGRIIDCGVRIFSEGVNDINTDKELSKNATRRMFRQMRRRLERRRHRKAKLLQLLQNNGLAPEGGDALQEFFALDPYQCRRIGLNRKIDLQELGRAVYHINQRRGFKSNRKAQKENDEERGKVKSAIASLSNLMQQSEAATLGVYFAEIKGQDRIRGRYTSRDMFADELRQLWSVQQQHYPGVLTDELYKSLVDDTVLFQIPFNRKSNSKSALNNQVGNCQFEHGKRRAPKSSLLFQEFRIWQAINNLRVIGGTRVDEESQYLTEEETERLHRHLMNNPSINTDEAGAKKLVKILGLPQLPRSESYQFKLRTLPYNTTRLKLTKALGDLQRFTDEQLEAMTHILQFAEDEAKTVGYAQRKWGLTAEEAQRFADITLEDGHGSLSTRAMKTILPHLRAGMQYHEACLAAGYHHSREETVEITGEVPRLLATDVRNPIVFVALNQVRIVANELYQRFGQPDSIRVEMGRELRIPKGLRAEMEKENRMREKFHKQIENIIFDELRRVATRADIIRYKLWDEAGRVCPYTGENIPLHRLFDEDIDIEHILPYSRTLDDSQMNKTICVRSANLAKGDQTPYERYHGKSEYDQILERVKASKMPRNKKVRFTMTPETFAERNGDFIQRQMNDMRHIAAKSRRLLLHLCPDVSVANGSITAMLRYRWGLNSILSDSGEKDRTDHRHHAVDALCIAFTSRSLLQRISTAHALQIWRYVDKRPKIDLPWPTFRADAEWAIGRIVVSHKVNRRARGQFHKATYYGRWLHLDGVTPRTSQKGTSLYLKRERLDAIQDTNKIYKIVDPAVRKIVCDRLIQCGISAEDIANEKKVSIPKTAFAEPLYMATKSGNQGPVIHSVRIAVAEGNMMPLYSGQAWVEPGNNHHYAIFEDERGRRYGSIITLFEAYRRMQYSEPVVNHSAPEGHKFICSVQQNEMWLLGIHPDEVNFDNDEQHNEILQNLYKVQKLSSGKITLTKPTIAMASEESFDKSPGQLKGFKVEVSPTGIIRKAKD